MSEPTEMPTQILPAITDDAGAPTPGPSGKRSGSKGPVLAVGAAVVTLVIGAFGGYLFGSFGKNDVADAGNTSSLAPTQTPVPVLAAGQTTSTVGAVGAVDGGTFALVTNDKSRVTVHTTPTTRVITLRGNTLGDVQAGDSAVVTGSRIGDVVTANLIIAGALPGLVPTTAPAPAQAPQSEIRPKQDNYGPKCASNNSGPGFYIC